MTLYSGCYETLSRNRTGRSHPCFLGTAGTAHATGSAPALAQTTKVQLTDRVTDRAGVLSEEEKADLESKYTEFTQSTGLVPFFVLFPDLGSSTGEQVAKQLFSASGGDNVLVFVVGVNDRQVGMQYGADWSQSRVEAIQKNATGALSSSDWAAAGRTLAGSDSDESGWWWLLGGGAVVAGGGAVAASRGRKNRRKQTEAMARDAREISPSDVSRLSSLPTPCSPTLPPMCSCAPTRRSASRRRSWSSPSRNLVRAHAPVHQGDEPRDLDVAARVRAAEASHGFHPGVGGGAARHARRYCQLVWHVE